MSAMTEAFAAAAAAAAVVAKAACAADMSAECSEYTSMATKLADLAAARPAKCYINENCTGYEILKVGAPACCGPIGKKTCQPQEADKTFGWGTCPSVAATGDAAGAVSADAVPDS